MIRSIKRIPFIVVCLAFIAIPMTVSLGLPANRPWKWGPPKDGIQLALRPTRRSFHGGQRVELIAKVRNSSQQPWRLWWPSSFGEFSISFSLTGPEDSDTGLTAYEAYISQSPPGGSSGWVDIKPGQTYAAGEYVLNHHFDITLPGIYRTVGNCGPKSAPIPIRIASPKAIRGLALVQTSPAKGYKWGPICHGMQLGIKPTAEAIKQFAPIRVTVEIRNTGAGAHVIHLVGLCAADFSNIQVFGPTGVRYRSYSTGKYLVFGKTKLTAYGRWLKKYPAKSEGGKSDILLPGKVYAYAKPLLISRRFDLTLPGIYRIQIRLADTGLKSGTIGEAIYDNDFFHKPKPKSKPKSVTGQR